MVSFETASWYTVRLNGDYSFQNAVKSGAISKASTRIVGEITNFAKLLATRNFGNFQELSPYLGGIYIKSG